MTTAVAIALYNGEKFIEKQLESLRNQTKQLDQVILCDDGSKDATVQLVRDYIAGHGLQDCWHLMINEKNLGYAGNFFHTMKQCNTDLIFLCDQDDIWRLDKVQKMSEVMEQNSHIKLLSSRHGVIDTQDQPIEGLLAPKENETFSLDRITMEDVLRSYRWPGMCMCIRTDYFKSLIPYIDDYVIPHDMVLTVCATDCGGFWEYGYIGADHRRHGNNAGKEEHRIWKVLNLRRKLGEVDAYNDMLDRIVKGKLPLTVGTKQIIQTRLTLSEARKDALKGRSFSLLKKAYTGEGAHLLRKQSLVCDIWLICFGNYREIQ